MQLYWTEQGFGDHFYLFHPGLTKPFRFRRYDLYSNAMHAPILCTSTCPSAMLFTDAWLQVHSLFTHD